MAKQDGDTVAQLLQEVFSDRDGAKRLLEHLVNQAMAAEISSHVAAGPHERTDQRRGYRNGFKPRQLNTRVGELTLDVPQVRACEPYHPSMFAKWQRSERALLVACAERYFQGVSTRNVRNVLEQMCGGDVSSATVSRVAQELDEKLLTFRHRRLNATEWPYMHIDARYERRFAWMVVWSLRRCWWPWASPARASVRCWTGVWATANPKRRGASCSGS